MGTRRMATRLVLLLFNSIGVHGIQIGSILIDASNLQLNVLPGVASSISSRAIDQLPQGLHLLSRYLAYLDPWGEDVPPDVPPPATVTVVYDGTAYYGKHASEVWLQRDEPEGAPTGGSKDGIKVVFTGGPLASADDELVRLAQESGSIHQQPLQPISVNAALDALQGDLPRPVIVVSRVRSVNGKSNRQQREVRARPERILELARRPLMWPSAPMTAVSPRFRRPFCIRAGFQNWVTRHASQHSLKLSANGRWPFYGV